MKITHLKLRDFRNVKQAEIEPHSQFNILAGNNGAGKSNVLEAIYILGNVRSFRSGRNGDLINLEASDSSVVADIVAGERKREICLEIDERRKRFSVNGKAFRSFVDFYGIFRAVAFTPSDMRLLQGGAKERRQHLDRVVAGVRGAHVADLRMYETVLKNRNQLLKEP